jgi:hypothetical protein
MQSLLEESGISVREAHFERDAPGRSTPFGTMLLLLFLGGLCVLGGCHDVAMTWSAEAQSPDGRWVATARSQQWGGPGTAYDATTVYLKQIEASKSPTQVLVFSHQYATMNLKMEWVTPTHLDVRYGPSSRPGDRVTLDFQVAKISGVDISVEDDLSGERTNSSQ